MTIQQLEYILDVNRTGSISRTAKNFMVSQSSVSNAINTLESELGFAIFDRNWQGAVPTVEGEEVLRHAAQICEHTRAIQAPKVVRQELSIATHAHPLFSKAFTALAGEYAQRDDLLLSHRAGSAEESIEQVARAKVGLYATLIMDLGGKGIERLKSMRQINNMAAELGLKVEVGGQIPLVLRIGPGHPLYRQERISMDAFRDDVIIDAPGKVMAHSFTVRVSLGYAPERTLTTMDARTRCELVAQGLGYSCGPQYPKELDQQYGFRNIVIPQTPVSLVTVRKKSEPAPEVKRYLALLEQEMARIGDE